MFIAGIKYNEIASLGGTFQLVQNKTFYKMNPKNGIFKLLITIILINIYAEFLLHFYVKYGQNRRELQNPKLFLSIICWYIFSVFIRDIKENIQKQKFCFVERSFLSFDCGKNRIFLDKCLQL